MQAGVVSGRVEKRRIGVLQERGRDTDRKRNMHKGRVHNRSED